MYNIRTSLDDLKVQLSEYVGCGFGATEVGLAQLHELQAYLEQNYPDDDVLRVLSLRAEYAALVSDECDALVPVSGMLGDELARIESWASSLEGGPECEAAWDWVVELMAFVNPNTHRLEPWARGCEQQVLGNLETRYGAPVWGEWEVGSSKSITDCGSGARATHSSAMLGA